MKTALGALLAVLSLAGGVYAYRALSSRPDCPGKIVCPLTGEVICADQCPVGEPAPAKADLPACCKPKP